MYIDIDIVIDISVGYGPLYIGRRVPDDLRGEMVSLKEGAIVLGIVAGFAPSLDCCELFEISLLHAIVLDKNVMQAARALLLCRRSQNPEPDSGYG